MILAKLYLVITKLEEAPLVANDVHELCRVVPTRHEGEDGSIPLAHQRYSWNAQTWKKTHLPSTLTYFVCQLTGG